MNDKLQQLKTAFITPPKNPSQKPSSKRQTQPLEKDVFAGLIANLKKKQMEKDE